MSTSIVDSINHPTMRSAVLEYACAWADDLQRQERAALSSIVEHVRGKRILDIGVGAGRTVKGLREVSEHYIGVDYVREMIDYCRKRFPDVRFEHADARAMTQFAAESFDLIVFPCNGLCMVDHVGRLQVLREVHRLLAPGGFFLFSTCNMNNPSRNRFLDLPSFEMCGDPARVIVRSARFVGHTCYRLFNRLRHRRHEVRTDEYEILNCKSHHYRTMIYFIGLEQQRRQLEQTGFQRHAVAFDLSGTIVETDTADSTITLVARK